MNSQSFSSLVNQAFCLSGETSTTTLFVCVFLCLSVCASVCWSVCYLGLCREGLVGWEGLDSVIGGNRRGRDNGRGRGGPGRGREGRGRHSGGRGGGPGPASGGRFDHDSLDFDQQGAPGRYSRSNQSCHLVATCKQKLTQPRTQEQPSGCMLLCKFTALLALELSMAVEQHCRCMLNQCCFDGYDCACMHMPWLLTASTCQA